jgi:hypothetical protein
MRPAPIRFFALFWILSGIGFQSFAQPCPETGVNESLYGTGAWNGYVYDGLNSFSSDNFIGTKNEASEFNETFASGQTDGGCSFTLETFSVRFKNRQTFACGLHTFTVTSNSTARLSIDGGSTFLINIASGTDDATVHLTGGTYELVLEYVHNTGSPQIGFEFDVVSGGDFAGEVSGDQTICDDPADPVAFASLSPARFCSGIPALYQWEVSFNGGPYSNIVGATGLTYNPPAGPAAGNYLYRRRATDGTTTVTSNDISVVVDIPEGDQSSFGNATWIGYAYEGADNFTSDNYLGYFEESALNFTEDFDAVAINGCDLPTEGFTVRFKRQEPIPTCGGYDITIEAEGGGARLYVDGTLIIDGYSPVTTLTAYSANIFLSAGAHQFILEYYNSAGANTVKFNLSSTTIAGGGGVIGTDQTACGAPYDPVAFTNIEDAAFCSGTVSYQWQEASSASGPWTDISSATSATYDQGSLGAGTHFYRREATNGSETVHSNVVQVDVKVPAGDESEYVVNTWRGYAYDGENVFNTTNYLGYFDVAALNFSEDFSAVSLNGCDLPEENFSVRFRREETTFTCGGYDITLTADDRVRLYLDGVQLTNGYTTSYSGNVFLDAGNHQFDIEYTVATGTKSVAFTITPSGTTSSGGLIGYGQDICSATLDPPAFQSLADAGYCSGPQTYQWQWSTSPTGPTWNIIPGANQATYDPPVLTPGVYYYRREYTDGSTSVFSNVLEVSAFTPMGDQTTFGDNEWIGYVYDDQEDWGNNYRGFITETTNFDESFCAGVCEFMTNGCPVEATEFSVLFKNRADFECGSYLITIGGDDGVQLSIDGVVVPELDALTPHSFLTYSKMIYFDGTPDTELDLKYFESAASNRVSFSATFLGPGYAGEIGGDDYSCEAGLDPLELTTVEPAISCSGPMVYQWQYSLDGLGWTDIPGANSETYDPGPVSITTYYRRQVTIDGYTLNSNVVTIEIDPPQGDEMTFGQNYWIGYVYDSYDGSLEPTDYHGYMIENTNFDRTFCGSSCTQEINGCDFDTDTFVIRYKNEMTLECGYYRIIIGFNDGGRLRIDGVTELSEWWFHGGYTTLETEVFLTAGTHQFEYDYIEENFGNRVSFNIEFLGAGTPAVIDRSQVLCSAPHDPVPLTEFVPPDFECSGDITPDYQWQISMDGVNWSDIPSAASSSYDPPANHEFTAHYRRKDTDDLGNELFSNAVTIVYNTDLPPYTGEEYGMAPEWIGHVYDGANNFTTNYLGSFIQPTTMFTQSFCGPNCIFELDGCDVLTTTFSVRFRTQIDLPAGSYTFTIDSEEAARLTIEGEEITSPLLVIDDFTPHGFGTPVSSAPVDLLGGTYFLVLDFFDAFSGNHVSFSYTSAPLPVTWSYFNGYYSDGQSFLEWHTASEINNEGFDVEHSTDGIHFVKIGWVEGHGTTNVANQYQFIHDHPEQGWNYYRLKQIDYNGAFEYSRLIPVFADDLPKVEIFPNPFRDHLYLSRINTDQSIQVTLTNILGQDPLVLLQDPMQPTRFNLPRRLEPGVYYARIRLGDVIHTRKVIIE